MSFCALAIDMGAGSIRLVRGSFTSDRLSLEEVYRFENKMVQKDGHWRWDVDHTFDEIKKGLQQAFSEGTMPQSVGVDTWGVDFALLDKEGALLEWPIAYRDERTEGMEEAFADLMPRQETFKRTGINFFPFNTLNQMMALSRETNGPLKKAATVLWMPDYFNYMLSGEKASEATICSTSQMLGVEKGEWDSAILKTLNIDSSLFLTPKQVPCILGPLKDALAPKETEVSVVAVGGHDTASAVAAVPAEDPHFAFISTGTWCLMGVEADRPALSEEALEAGFTNERGLVQPFRVLKNLMGLWLIMGLKKSLCSDTGFGEISTNAEASEPFQWLVNPNDGRFYNPEDMKEAFDDFFRESGQPIPTSPWSYFRCAYDSLALSFRQCLEQLESQKLKEVHQIHMVGGGCYSNLLCQLTANVTGRPVWAGPAEGASIGNLMAQAVAKGVIPSFQEGRRIVRNSFEILEYQPEKDEQVEEAYKRFKGLGC